MFEKFTDRARRVVVLAQEEARELKHNYIGTEHILLGLIAEREGIAARALQSMGLTLDVARAEVEATIGRGSKAPEVHIPFTPRAKRSLELSLREALRLRHKYIGTEHLLLGLLREGEGVAAKLLDQHGASFESARAKVLELLGGGGAEELGDLAREAVESTLAQPFPTTPAAQRALERLRELPAEKQVSSLDLLLALLQDPESAASRALSGLLPTKNLDELVQQLQDSGVAGTADELPQEAGLRGMTLRLTDDAFLIEITDPHLLAQARETFGTDRSVIAGDDPSATSLTEVWLGLAASLAEMRSKA